MISRPFFFIMKETKYKGGHRMNFHEEAFEGTVEIVAAAMEEAEVELSA